MDYVQLIRFVMSKGIDPIGSYDIVMREKNTLFWKGFNKQLVDVLLELFEEEKIVSIPYPLEVYKLDRFNTDMPIAQAIPESGFSELTFVPTCLGLR